MTTNTTNLNLEKYDPNQPEDANKLFLNFIESNSNNFQKIDGWAGSPQISGSAFTLGGLHVGGNSSPGNKNLIVDGKALISGSLVTTKEIEVYSNLVEGGKISLKDSGGGRAIYTNSGSLIFSQINSNSSPVIINAEYGSYYMGCGIENPKGKNIGDRFFRTDLGEEIYYAGSGSWLTTNTFSISSREVDVLENSDILNIWVDDDYQPYITKVIYHSIVESPANPSNYWNIRLSGYNTPFMGFEDCISSTSIQNADTDNKGTIVPLRKTFTKNSYYWGVSASKINSPGGLDIEVTLYYKLVIT